MAGNTIKRAASEYSRTFFFFYLLERDSRDLFLSSRTHGDLESKPPRHTVVCKYVAVLMTSPLPVSSVTWCWRPFSETRWAF